MSLSISKSKKIIIPGINIKDITPLASLISPKEVVITMSLISIIAQISENLRSNLDVKEIQKVPSVKFYSKLINNSTSTISLSTIFSIAKTIGPELEILSSLNNTERFHLLYLLKKSIINERIAGRISSKTKVFTDPFELLRYRKGLSLQTRSIMLATALFMPHSIVLGIPINQIDINVILESSRILWSYWGLTIEEFEFLLRKEAIYHLKSLGYPKFFDHPNNPKDCVRILFFSTLKELAFFNDKLVFTEDNVLFKSNNNLCLLEKDFAFIDRLIPDLPDSISEFDYDLEDKLIRLAFNQRKDVTFSVENFVKQKK